MNKAILFDLDGTLIDSVLDLAISGNHTRKKFGLEELQISTVKSFVGNGLGNLLKRLLPKTNVSDSRPIFENHYSVHCCDNSAPYDGIIDLLEKLEKDNWKLGVVTNKPLAFTKIILEKLNMSKYFGFVIGGDGIRKPDPEPLLEGFKILDADVNLSWMVGDHNTDINAAKAAKCKIAFCEWGIGKHDNLSCDAMLKTPSDLINAL